MPDRLQVLVRADGGARIGAGHLMRTWSLAQALNEVGCEVRFAGTAESRALFGELGGAEESWLDVDDPNSPQALGARAGRCDLLVVDHYGLDHAFETACRPWVASILAIDDAPTRRHDCDLLLDQTWGRSPAAYDGLLPGDCRLLAGSTWALLRPGFFRARIAAVTDRSSHLQRVFVALGATDASQTLIPCLESLRAAAPALCLDAIISSRAPHLAEIRSAARRLDVSLHVDVRDVSNLMARAHVAVIAAGSVTWEACCAGLLPVLLVTADNQRDIAAALGDAGAALRCDDAVAVGPLVNTLLDDANRCAAIVSQAASLCDGLGARRVAMELVPERTTDTLPVTFRPATMDDAQIFFEWQSAPETRRFARNPQVPAFDEHVAWMAERLKRQDSVFNVVLHGGVAAGVVRLDRIGREGLRFEVSIYTAPGRHGLGIGKAALRLVRRLLPEAEFLAHVLPQNTASCALFQSAGYIPHSGGFRSTPAAGQA